MQNENFSVSIERIQSLLEEKLQPSHLTIEDESGDHIGHAGARQGAHYSIHIASPYFQGKSRLESHRMVFNALDGLIGIGIHALKIKIIT